MSSDKNSPPPRNQEPTDNTYSNDESLAAKESKQNVEPQYPWQVGTDFEMADVGGLEHCKDVLERNVIKPLKTEASRLNALGIEPSNVLLYGAPGTGKTMVAKAVASETALPFVRLSGGDLTSKWINESPQLVKRLFREASAVADSHDGAIIFLDELDSLLAQRDAQSHEENRKVVNEFLNELQETPRNVVVLGATNRFDDLDPAAIRRGRFDKHVEIGYPDLNARIGILRSQLRCRNFGLEFKDIRNIAEMTSGMSGADLARLVDEAAHNAAFARGDNAIRAMDFREVLSK